MLIAPRLRLDLFALEKEGPGPRRAGSPNADLLHERRPGSAAIGLPSIAVWRFSTDDPAESGERRGFFARVRPVVIGAAVAGAVLYLMLEGMCFGSCDYSEN